MQASANIFADDFEKRHDPCQLNFVTCPKLITDTALDPRTGHDSRNGCEY